MGKHAVTFKKQTYKKKRKNYLKCLGLAAAGCLWMMGCGEAAEPDVVRSSGKEQEMRYHELTTDENGQLVISKSDITANVAYYNYVVDGVTVQVLAIAGADGTPHLAFNTCQSCNPSPQAYYQQEGDGLTCGNCGFQFTPDQVGVVAGGCNPMPVAELTEDEETYYIPAQYLADQASVFASWEGPVK